MLSIKRRAQAGLEYLMTYGWALVLVATLIGILVFVVGGPTSNATFTSSDPAKFPVKGGTMANNVLELLAQNVTGGNIMITRIDFIGADLLGGTKLNGTEFTENQALASPITVVAGGELHFTEIAVHDEDGDSDYEGSIRLTYTDYASLQRTITFNFIQTGVDRYS